jgi:hypothetical protein
MNGQRVSAMDGMGSMDEIGWRDGIREYGRLTFPRQSLSNLL